MKASSKNVRQSPEAKRVDREIRPAVKWFVFTVCAVCMAMTAIHLVRGKLKRHDASSPVEVITESQKAKGTTDHLARSQRDRIAGENVASLPQTRTAALHEPAPELNQIMEELARIGPVNGPLTDEEAAAWKEKLAVLIQKGDAAIPVIREFLAKNWDVNLDEKDREKIGYASVRQAMIDALMQINSPQAVLALNDVLQGTIRPQEVALVTQFLEKNQPGVYLDSAFSAAQRLLASAANGSLPETDMSPLFQLFQRYEYDNTYTVPILKGSVNQWDHYATMALAQLPSEAGVPALTQIATGQEGSIQSARLAAMQALSGMASQSSSAREAMLNLAAQNCISAYDWGALVPYLAGNQFAFVDSALGNSVAGINPADLRSTYISASQQSYWTAPLGAMSPSQIDQQKAFIDQLLSATYDSAAIKALQQAKAMLDNRLSLLANSSGN